MVALIDTNIFIDFLSSREPFSENAKKIIEHCKNKRFSGLIVSQSVVDSFYILRKVCPMESLKKYFINLSYIFNFVGTSERMLINALNNADFSDFEDCVIYETAMFNNVDCIVTRNPKDYSSSKIKIYTPEEFLNILD